MLERGTVRLAEAQTNFLLVECPAGIAGIGAYALLSLPRQLKYQQKSF
jgi:hypothetical protein